MSQKGPYLVVARPMWDQLREERWADQREIAALLAIADFWEAEAARGRANKIAGETDRHAWEAWGGETGEATGAYVVELGRPRSVPRIVWWHANRRTR